MPDGTVLNLGAGGDTIATDELTLMNGGVVSGIKVERVKVGFGSDAAFRDVDAANGLPVVGVFFQATQPVSLATVPAIAEIRAATLHVTATAAVNTAITATLPAPGVGLFHYITSVKLTKLYSVIGVAAGAGVVITSTNLPGTPAWLTPQAAGAVGTTVDAIDYQPTTPLKSAAANIATTFVAPAQLQTIWRWNISYFTAP